MYSGVTSGSGVYFGIPCSFNSPSRLSLSDSLSHSPILSYTLSICLFLFSFHLPVQFHPSPPRSQLTIAQLPDGLHGQLGPQCADDVTSIGIVPPSVGIPQERVQVKQQRQTERREELPQR